MTTVAIPEWNTLGLLPPIDPADSNLKCNTLG